MPLRPSPRLSSYISLNRRVRSSGSQSRDLRVINSLIDPKYRAKNDTYELNIDFHVTPELTLTWTFDGGLAVAALTTR